MRSILVEITVSGVFSSWLALVMNCFCCSMFRMVGSMAFRLASVTNSQASRMPPAQASSDSSARLRTAASRVSTFRNSTVYPPRTLSRI